MKIVSISYPLTSEQKNEHGIPQIAAIGQFDGLHMGHASVISTAVGLAHKEGIPAAVITFYPHPKDVMRKGNYEGYLTPQPDKQELLVDMGVDILYVVDFNEELSQVSPEDFVKEMLMPLQLHTAVVGFDFRFGFKGAGRADLLYDMSEGTIRVVTVPPFLMDGEKVGSSSIRAALYSGHISDATRWLGRNYRIRGTVIHGEKRGRALGFRTANLELLEHYVTPALGVYAVWARCTSQEEWLPGVMSIGLKPTFHEGIVKPIYEVHLLDFDGDLYGQTMIVDVVQFIRKELKFNSVEELIEGIRRDVDETRKILNR